MFFPVNSDRVIRSILFGAFLVPFSIPAQTPTPARRVDARNTYRRIYCVVPMVGAGTWADPKRPKYAPAAPQDPTSRSGILAYAYQPSDDGNFALVQFVAVHRAAFHDVQADASAKTFQRGTDDPVAILTEFQKYKKGFKLDTIEVAVP